MKKLLGRKKAQSVTEFVLIIPVILLLLVGVIQFFYIMLDYIKLGMVEREVVMYCSMKEKVTHSGLQKFTEQYSSKLGMDKSRIKATNTSAKAVEDFFSKAGGFGKLLNKLGVSYLVNLLYGIDLKITYEVKLMNGFAAMAGKKTLTLATRIHSGLGQVFAMNLDPMTLLKKIFDLVWKGLKWLMNLVWKGVLYIWHLFF